MKTLTRIFILSVFTLICGLSLNANVSNQYSQSVTEAVEEVGMNFSSVIVAFLYFLGVLLLIYLILVLVSRWGKKQKNDESEDIRQENAEGAAVNSVNDEDKDKTNG